jgi:inner membrane protein
MHGGTHFIVGLGLGLLFVKPETALLDVALILGSTVIGALLPDVDTPGSTLAKWIKPLKIFSIVGHRGIFHSWLIPGLLLLASWQMGRSTLPYAMLASLSLQLMFWGCISHLILDAFNPSGIPLFWPLPRAVRLLPLQLCVKSGGFADWGIMFLSTAIFLYAFNAYYPSVLLSIRSFLAL